MDPNRKIKVFCKAGEIPLGSTVTKRTGQKQYVLCDRLRIFGADPQIEEVVAHSSTRFLVSEGDANAIPTDLELLWVARPWELKRWIEGPEEDK